MRYIVHRQPTLISTQALDTMCVPLSPSLLTNDMRKGEEFEIVKHDDTPWSIWEDDIAPVLRQRIRDRLASSK